MRLRSLVQNTVALAQTRPFVLMNCSSTCAFMDATTLASRIFWNNSKHPLTLRSIFRFCGGILKANPELRRIPRVHNSSMWWPIPECRAPSGRSRLSSISPSWGSKPPLVCQVTLVSARKPFRRSPSRTSIPPSHGQDLDIHLAVVDFLELHG
jgi:hypothetical protein